MAVNDLTSEQLEQVFTPDPDGWRKVEPHHYCKLLAMGMPTRALWVDGALTFRVLRRSGKTFAVFEI